MQGFEPADAGLYVHVPFCPSKCGYCDFYSRVPAEGQIEPLVDALLAELDAVDTPGVRIETIFVGGGTPTCLPVPNLRRLFDRLGRCARRPGVVEFTVETNPDTLDADKAAILQEAGVNRISMGAQSFHEAELRVLDRTCGPARIARAADLVRRAGFEHFNIDLLFGIPGQSLSTWEASLRQAIALGPDHLACYALTLERGTPLWERVQAGLVASPGEQVETDMYTRAIEWLAGAGFAQYEISNFARPGARCRHNLRYWRNRPVLGVGPAAASYQAGRRWRNIADTAEYVRRVRSGEPTAIESESLSPRRRAGETAMLMLRLVEGIDAAAFARETGFDPHVLFAEAISRHAAAGRLVTNHGRIALTPAGRLVADTVMADFLDPEPGAAGRRAAALPPENT